MAGEPRLDYRDCGAALADAGGEESGFVHPADASVARPAPVFEFEDLTGLPCGCVAAEFRAADWGVRLVSLEAKGPLCHLTRHFVGQVLRLVDDEGEDDADEGGVAAAAA